MLPIPMEQGPMSLQHEPVPSTIHRMEANGGSRVMPEEFVFYIVLESPTTELPPGSQYVPAPQEAVIGVITQRLGEGFRVDIGSAHYASLDGLAFEGATKRNKPNLKARCYIFLQKIQCSLICMVGRKPGLCSCFVSP
jgi:hypothetical protein